MKTRQQIGFGVMTLLLAAAVICFFIFRKDPFVLFKGQSSCYFSGRFHLYCPGCGGTRAVMHLFRGELTDSLLSNPIPIYIVALFVRIYVALFHNVVTARAEKKQINKAAPENAVNGNTYPEQEKKNPYWKVMYQWEMWGILVVVIGFFILRNLALVALHWDFLGNMVSFW